MMIWSMPVPFKGVEDQAAIKEAVESLNRLGYPELIVRSDKEPATLPFRDAVIRELKDTFWCSSNRTSSTKIRFCVLAGMVENANKQVKEMSANLGDCDAGVTRCCHGP